MSSTVPTKDIVVLLYSKYSTKCQAFLRALEGMAEQASALPITLHMLCVDNEEVRQLLQQDAHGYSVQRVPCILVFSASGLLEKFEGVDAASWLQKTKRLLQESVPVSASTPIPQSVSPLPTSTTFLDQSPPSTTMESKGAGSSSTSSKSNMGTAGASPSPAGTATAQMMTRKKENILSVAASMAKQREKEDEILNPNPYAKAHEAQKRISEGQQ